MANALQNLGQELRLELRQVRISSAMNHNYVRSNGLGWIEVPNAGGQTPSAAGLPPVLSVNSVSHLTANQCQMYLNHYNVQGVNGVAARRQALLHAIGAHLNLAGEN